MVECWQHGLGSSILTFVTGKCILYLMLLDPAIKIYYLPERVKILNFNILGQLLHLRRSPHSQLIVTLLVE